MNKVEILPSYEQMLDEAARQIGEWLNRPPEKGGAPDLVSLTRAVTALRGIIEARNALLQLRLSEIAREKSRPDIRRLPPVFIPLGRGGSAGQSPHDEEVLPE